jgi:hypothetical protein
MESASDTDEGGLVTNSSTALSSRISGVLARAREAKDLNGVQQEIIKSSPPEPFQVEGWRESPKVRTVHGGVYTLSGQCDDEHKPVTLRLFRLAFGYNSNFKVSHRLVLQYIKNLD